MGCTSSAQNMPPSLVNSGKAQSHAGREVEDQAMEEIKMSEERGESKETQVLPTCDTVDSHTISKIQIAHTDSSPDLEKGSRGNREVTESGNSQSDSKDHDITMTSRHDDVNSQVLNDDLETEEKLGHLEEVVEKVVELYENGELEIKPTESVATKVEDTQTKPEQVAEVTEERREEIDKAKEEDHIEEPASPSQSASSRATRWEALADIAAELPPSLAVDPVTGQIYALSKH